jgi:UDP-N-acetylmuramoylalanine-D-glutamate ligase
VATTRRDFVDADAVFVTPGIPRTHPLVQKAAQAGVPVSSEIELLFELCPVPIAAITGSAGKTTTTTLHGADARSGEFADLRRRQHRPPANRSTRRAPR